MPLQKLMQAGKNVEALRYAKELEESAPTDLHVLTALAILHGTLGQPDEAETYFARAHEHYPNEPKCLENLLVHLHSRSKHDQVLELVPREHYGNHGQGIAEVIAASLLKLGDADLAYNGLKQLIERFPQSQRIARVWVNLQLYPSEVADETVDSLHLSLARSFESFVRPNDHFYNSQHPDRKLRLGFLTLGANSNAISYFLLPILENLDPDQFDVSIYSLSTNEDAFTKRYEELVTRFRRCAHQAFDAVANQIQADKIDILIDIDSNWSGDSPAIIAKRPAPVQFEYLGYPCWTRSSRVQGRLVDAITDPIVGPALCQLDGCFVVYSPVTALPPTQPCSDGPIVFGSFNNTLKLSQSTLALWAKVLAAVPESVLFLKYPFFDAEHNVRRVSQILNSYGIESDRVRIDGMVRERSGHLEAYSGVHIALDTHPYNGTTTTFEALSMGVPVVTLRGKAHRSRVGASILTNLGRPEWVAETEDDYVKIAKELASDLDGVKRLRSGLRRELLESPLSDAEAFTERLVEALREMWHRWCQNPV